MDDEGKHAMAGALAGANISFDLDLADVQCYQLSLKLAATMKIF